MVGYKAARKHICSCFALNETHNRDFLGFTETRNWLRTQALHIVNFAFVSADCSYFNGSWPAPIRRYESRPPADPYCKAGVIPFCPSGEARNSMPLFHPDDQVEIYAMKKPVWQFKFGNTLGKFKIMHDAVGIKNLNTGLNYTMEWYELFQLFNCTFPHMRDEGKEITWCNQGAVCIYDGIEDRIWKENGTLVKVASTTGDTFNKFAQWVLWDNDTGLFYETWTVRGRDGQFYFYPFDCASWVLRAFEEMGTLGVQFNQSIKLNYTRITLYSDEPQCLGNATDIFDPRGKSHKWKKDILYFYSNFQPHLPLEETIEEIINTLVNVFVLDVFFLYYNSEYWLLPMIKPFVALSYELVPLPSNV
ncbi:hypothetical protein KUTeg_022119 [Tegillarca granosa]|uniref:Bis(monoacylglycero)phosphate synthase CLN5 n=1 Tax=Tegillarca granosa TaxID=220873 RepID=A0ABQ9EAV2_TEGGR|nr:hypothetical protein KUTeg_022119 [Tegillarca granosa]